MAKAYHGPTPAGALLTRLESVVGARGMVTAAADMEPHLTEPRGRYRGRAVCVVRPADTGEIAEVVRICAAARVPVVPQGGNTGLVGGGTPFEDGRAVVVSLGRLNRVRAVDPVNDTITVDAGCILQEVQRAAEAADRLFPLSLGAEGTCQIGGNISTNAGGIQVLRYGNMRELVLGLEVVLPDGRVWEGLRALRKDNTGYDLKQLFIGAEGTLGIVTAAVLRLFPRPKQTATAFAAVRDVEAAVQLLGRVRAKTGDAVTSFELIPRIGLDMVLDRIPGVRDPMGERHRWYVLVELWSGREDGRLAEALESILAEANGAGLVPDAALASSQAQADAFWRIREGVVEAQRFEGGSIKHDVSVPIPAVPAFIARACARAEELVPGIRPIPFGHIGDGNVHLNLSQPKGADRDAFLARWGEVNRAVHEIAIDLGGSISAEHGIGRMKIADNRRAKLPLEIELMGRIKDALDPANLMNPGKVVER